jgi:multidrug efflux pump subunit AcrA (membrane-fusion protein)
MRDMITEAPIAASRLTSDDAWQEIEDSLEDIAELAKSDLPPRDFHRQLLDRLVRALSSTGGAIWLANAEGHLRADYRVRLEQILPADDLAGRQHHARLLAEVLRRGQATLVPPRAGDQQSRNPSSNLLILCPLVLQGRALGLIEIFQRPDPRPDVQQGYLRIVAAAGDLAGDYHRDRQLRELHDRQSWWHQWREFSEAVHGSLDLKPTAYAIVNEGRRVLRCDRVSLAVRRGRRCRLVATSGVDTVHRRSASVRRLEALARLVLASQEPLWHPNLQTELPPEMETLLDAYVDESCVRWLAVVPLRESARNEEVVSDPRGVLIVERFDAGAEEGLRECIQSVCSPAATALRNSLEHEAIPFLPVLRWLRRAGQCLRLDRLPKTLLAIAVVVAAVAALVKVPTDFEILARGELQPVVRHHVFAPQDGLVAALPKAAGVAVRKGESLAALSNPKLDQEYADVVAKRRTTEEQLAAVRATRMRQERSTGTTERYELSAQEQQLQEKLTGLERQAQLLAEQRQQLDVASPIDGQILTWDLERLLAARPVQQGEKLMTVADLSGPWQLELKIDDDQAGHVLAAQQEFGPDLAVSFILATDPNTRYQGKIESLAPATEVDEEGHASLYAFVGLAESKVSQPRPGATVVARIHCGRQPLGYVWFRQLWEAVQSRVLF